MVLKKHLQELIDCGHIRPNTSPYAVSALFALKKSGELYICVDYKILNKQTIKNKYPLPLISELLDQLSKALYFSKLELLDGYYHILVKESDRAKTAFHTPYGHFEFVVMPFGLVNASAIFQRMMNDVLREYFNVLREYLDNIIVYSKNREEHVARNMSNIYRKFLGN